MKKLLLSLLLCTPLFGHANEQNKVTIGAGWGDYELDEYFDSPTLLGWNAGHYSVFYTRSFTNGWAADAGYYDVNKGSVFELDAMIFSASKYFYLGNHNEIFVRAGLNYYQYEISSSSDLETDIDEDGVGYVLGLGWRYKFDNNVGIGITPQIMSHGDLDSYALDFSVSYSF